MWDRLRNEIDRAGRVAHDALDEGKVRLDAFRARQRADKCAQALGYAIFRARKDGRELEPETYARLSSELAAAESEATSHEAEVSDAARRRQEMP
ncbi:MAG: hypothetical protein ACRENI_04065 [Gemmatimonadaceae bacterium]